MTGEIPTSVTLVNPSLRTRSIAASSSNDLWISDLPIRFNLRISSLISADVIAFFRFFMFSTPVSGRDRLILGSRSGTPLRSSSSKALRAIRKCTSFRFSPGFLRRTPASSGAKASLCLSPFHSKRGALYSHLERVVGSHQASVLPCKEESFVMNDRTTFPRRPFERAAGPDLMFDWSRINSVFFLSHMSSKIGREFWRWTISIRFCKTLLQIDKRASGLRPCATASVPAASLSFLYVFFKE